MILQPRSPYGVYAGLIPGRLYCLRAKFQSQINLSCLIYRFDPKTGDLDAAQAVRAHEALLFLGFYLPLWVDQTMPVPVWLWNENIYVSLIPHRYVPYLAE